MLNFETSSFAVAGLIAAVGPIVIHLWNRRRYRSVFWGAMEFLREALQQSRRRLELRDVLLLTLRVIAVILVGVAFARPYSMGTANRAFWQGLGLVLGVTAVFGAAIGVAVMATSRRERLAGGVIGLLGLMLVVWSSRGWVGSKEETGRARGGHGPVHAVVLVDNSRSMGAELLGTTLLEVARSKAKAFLAALPPESRMTVIPLAGSEETISLDASRQREEAEKILDQIVLVDAREDIPGGLMGAAQACRQVTDVSAKRVVLMTDLQRSAFRDVDWNRLIEPLGGLQIAVVGAEKPSNIWISDFRLAEGLASEEEPCRFVARVSSSGSARTASVLVRLRIDGKEVGSQTVELMPDQTREVTFTHSWEGGADPQRVNYRLAEIALQCDPPGSDRLEGDNRRWLAIPLVASLPVVFVDEFGEDEDVGRNRIGETYALRHLLSPKTTGELESHRLIRVIHLRQDQLTEEVLKTARLVVMAGVERPAGCVRLLREFVVQGGPLLLLAGGRFDPAAWNEVGWLEGEGILPAPLRPETFGATPTESAEGVQPFFADFRSMQHEFFLVADEDPERLAALFATTPFFKAVRMEVDTPRLGRLGTSEVHQGAEAGALMSAPARRGLNSMAWKEERSDRQPEPTWWRWRTPSPLVDRSRTPEEPAERSEPRVLAEFQVPALPFVVERRVGAGRIVFVTSGVTSDWNLLRVSGAMYVFHRMISGLLEQTLPARNYEAGERIVVPMTRPAEVRPLLTRPSGRTEELTVEAVTAESTGVQIRSSLVSGAYRLRMASVTDPVSADEEWLFAVNGSASESDLTRLTSEALMAKIGRDDVRVLEENEEIDVEGGARRGRGMWQACLVAVGLVLCGEMLLVTLSRRRGA